MIDMDKCFAVEQMVTKRQFGSLDPRTKGYIVYMLGSRDDQPNVQKNYSPSKADTGEFNLGQHMAVIEAQDCP